jgi:sialidase-1
MQAQPMAGQKRITASVLAAVVWVCGVSKIPTRGAEALLETDRPLFINHDVHTYRLPSLIVTEKGTVLAACQKKIGRTDWDRSSFVLRRSCDGGKTFDPEQVIYERADYVTFTGNLIEDRDTGTIFACFIAFPFQRRRTWFQETWLPRGGGFMIAKSQDDGRTWSEPVQIMPEPNAEGWHGAATYNCNHGVQLRYGPHAGRLVAGGRVFKEGVYWGRAKGGLVYSDDHGATWHVGAVVMPEHGGVNGEVTVGQTVQDEVYVNSRNCARKEFPRRIARGGKLPEGIVLDRRIYSRSKDGGETFYEEGYHDELLDPPCNAGQARYCTKAEGGRNILLHTKPAGEKLGDRSHLTCYVSYDEGRSWPRGRVVSEKSGGYSDVAVTADKTILTLYENRRDDSVPKGMLLARFNLECLLGELEPR